MCSNRGKECATAPPNSDSIPLAVPPAQDPKRAQRIPPARRTYLLHFEETSPWIPSRQRPTSVRSAPLRDESNGIREARISRGSSGAERVEGAKNVVTPIGRKMEARHLGAHDVAGRGRPIQVMLEKELASSFGSSRHRT